MIYQPDMEKAKYGTTARIPRDTYDRVSKAAKECGVPVGTFITDALEDILSGYDAKAVIRPRCIAKAEAHGSNPVVESTTRQATQRKKTQKTQKTQYLVRNISG